MNDVSGYGAVRTGEETMRRAMCLFAVSYAAIHNAVDKSVDLLRAWDLEGSLTPIERGFLTTDPMPAKQRVALSWRCEAMVPLMWATGLFEMMPEPTDTFDFEYLSEFWLTVPAGYWKDVEIRPEAEIISATDHIRDLHWRLRDAELHHRPPPPGIDQGVVIERHHALNWLCRYEDDDWDDVATDT